MYSSTRTLMPDFDEFRCESLRTSVENDPLIDQDAYYEMVECACSDVVQRLVVECSWSTLGRSSFQEILKNYYNQQIDELSREYGVVPEMWDEEARARPADRQQAMMDVIRFATDEIGNREDVILRRAKEMFISQAKHIEIRVRRDGIEVVNLYQSASNIASRNHLDQKLESDARV